MAGSLDAFAAGHLTPAPSQQTLAANYLSAEDFDFVSQYLPELDAQEFERFGPRTVAGFLQLTGSEIPFASDLIKWAEQGRLHTKYEGCTQSNFTGATGTDDFDIASGTCTFRVGQTLLLSNATTSANAIVTAVSGTTFTVRYYQVTAASPFVGASDVTAFAYGSEFGKGREGMASALEAEVDVFEVKPIIIKEMYQVSGSDMAQIGWIEISTEEGGSGYFWFLKSSSETRLRFNDYMEMSLIEGVPVEDGSQAESYTELVSSAAASAETKAGTDGLFYAIEQRGNVWSGGNPTAMSDFDSVLQRLDKQGSIEENMLFLNRQFALDIDDMLAAQNSYGAGGTSYGVFGNSQEMALNLGFDGFRRGGYEFYKTDWKYLNDPTLRGGLVGGAVNGVMVPAGQTTVYDQVLGKNATRPFLHVRYRASEHENRRYKSWVTGSAGGARTSSLDAMTIDFLTERALCTMGANNFMLFNA
jgi:hypothetical protein